MKKMEELKEMLCTELDKLAGKGSISKTDLENIHMLTDTIKNLDKMKMLEEQEYSGDGEWLASGRYSRANRSYDGMSRRDSYMGNSYTNDYIIGAQDDSMYSRAGQNMSRAMEEKMRDPHTSHEDKEILRRTMNML